MRHDRYITGERFEDIPPERLKPADLITDFFGAFSYSAEKFGILLKYIDLLKPGGQIYVHTSLPVFERVLPEGGMERVSFYDWLKEAGLPGVKVWGGSDDGANILIEPGESTRAVLEELRSRLRFDRIEDQQVPPVFIYRLD